MERNESDDTVDRVEHEEYIGPATAETAGAGGVGRAAHDDETRPASRPVSRTGAGRRGSRDSPVWFKV